MEQVKKKAFDIVSKAAREHRFRLAKNYIYEGGKKLGQDPRDTYNHITEESWEIFKARSLANEANVCNS